MGGSAAIIRMIGIIRSPRSIASNTVRQWRVNIHRTGLLGALASGSYPGRIGANSRQSSAW